MKTIFQLKSLLGVVAVLALLITLTSKPSAAEEPDLGLQIEALEAKIEALETQNDQTANSTDLGFQAELDNLYGNYNLEAPVELDYNCTVKYQDWPTSNTYKDSDWAIEDFYATHSTYGSGPHYYDLNGDGLLDYFLVFNNGAQRDTCVQLNNGSGFELVHKCRAVYDDHDNNNQDYWRYWGDCAEV